MPIRPAVFLCVAALPIAAAACGSDDGATSNGMGAETPKVGEPELIRAPAGSPSKVIVAVPVAHDPEQGSKAGYEVKVAPARVAVETNGHEGEYAGRPDADSTHVLPLRPGPHLRYTYQYLSRAGADAVVAALGSGGSAKVSARASIEAFRGSGGPAVEKRSSTGAATVSNFTSPQQALREQQAGLAQSDASEQSSASHLVSFGGTTSEQEATGTSLFVGAGVGGYSGNDPCGHFKQGSDCQNVRGSTWTATHFLDSNRQRVRCPNHYKPVKDVSIAGVNIPYHSNDATTNKYTISAIEEDHGNDRTDNPTDDGTRFLTVNDNIPSHHHTMTPVTACE